jgi:dipeptidyl aminopeptidase/acylaminoacyl peptidase
MRRNIFTLCVIAVLALAVAASSVMATAAPAAPASKLSYLSKLPPLIDRDLFFGDPVIARGQISPDGAHISFLKPYRNVLNIWVKELDQPFEAARPMTADTSRPVRQYFWSRDGKYILYVQDKGGNENYHLYAVDPVAKLEPGQDVPPARDLTPLEKVTVRLYSLPKNTPNVAYIGLNDRDERYHDLYRLDLTTGERTLLRTNTEEIVSWVFDLEGNLRLASRQTSDGGTEILLVKPDTMLVVYTCSKDETADPLRFHKDGKRLYLATDKGDEVNLSRLILFNPDTRQEEYVESDPKNEVDFGGAEFSEKTDDIIATYYVGDRLRIYFKDKDWEKDYNKIKKQLPEGDIYLGSATKDERLLIVSATSDTDPGATYLFNRDTGKAEFLYRPRPDLPVKYLAPMKPIVYTSRDGLTIHGYLTIPQGVKEKNLAVLVVPHGGPWSRDEWGYDPYAQFFANRGYAVFQMNFRGSTGYGKKFLNAGNREWGDAMQNDITDGVEYLIKQGIADPKRVAIFGGSYGGYATLAGVAFTPDLYAAGIDYVGPSNIATLLNSIPPYWAALKSMFNERVGDPNKPEDAERLKRQSPLFSATKIKAPLLVVQGANDPRVKKAEADQIVVALRDLGRDVEYIVAPDEGHGFAGRENRTAFAVAAEEFLAKHLGGRYQEAVPEDIQNRLASITVDVATVKMPGAPTGAADAETAPLPTVNTSLIKPMSLAYKAVVSTAGQTMNLDISRTVSTAMLGGTPVWRIATAHETPMGGAADTFDLDTTSMLPIRWSVQQGQATVLLNYAADAVKGIVKMGTNEMPIDVALKAPVFGDGAALEVVLVGLPLAPGYRTALRVFDFQAQSSRPMSVAVAGSESVTVPAGTYDCLKVEVTALDEGTVSETLYMNAKDPRCMVRGIFVLPAQAGGGTLTADLASVK